MRGRIAHVRARYADTNSHSRGDDGGRVLYIESRASWDRGVRVSDDGWIFLVVIMLSLTLGWIWMLS